jgi:hypothetical protein
LASATPIRFNSPAQAWFADINAKWMLGVFTAEIDNAQHCGAFFAIGAKPQQVYGIAGRVGCRASYTATTLRVSLCDKSSKQ